jgi:hypothetical protein
VQEEGVTKRVVKAHAGSFGAGSGQGVVFFEFEFPIRHGGAPSVAAAQMPCAGALPDFIISPEQVIVWEDPNNTS